VLFKTDEVRDSRISGASAAATAYTARIPLKDLAIGSYVLKVAAKSRLGATPPVARELQFTVEAPIPAPAR